MNIGNFIQAPPCAVPQAPLPPADSPTTAERNAVGKDAAVSVHVREADNSDVRVDEIDAEPLTRDDLLGRLVERALSFPAPPMPDFETMG